METDNTTIEIITPNGGKSGPMPFGKFEAAVKEMCDDFQAAQKNGSENFQLEPETPGEIPQRVIDELVHARTVAKDYAEAFNGAVTAQAEKFKIAPGALKRYVNAREADAMAKLNKETADLEKLIGVTE